MVFKVLLAQDVANSGKKLLRENGCEIILAPDENSETIKSLITDCDAVFSKTLFLSEDILKAGKKLKVVAKHGVGIDNVIDVNVATKLGIYVVRTPLANMNSVAEHTMLAVLGLAKNVLAMDEAVRKGDFNAPERYKNYEVDGKVIGLIGLGNVGRSVAKKAYCFGMKIIGYDPYIDPCTLPEYIEYTDDLDQIFKESDFVSLHLSASEQTRGLVNIGKLALMKPTAFLLNFSRGSIVNEKDLYEALKNKIISGAALDVFATEPVEKDNPLLTLDNVLLSPHSAALTVEAMDRMSYQGAQGIIEILNGKVPTWCVNYEEVNKIRQNKGLSGM